LEDAEGLAELLHSQGALAVFDYAGAGSYVPVSMAAPEGRPLAYKDAAALSPHKMLGGPGACGLLVARRQLFGSVPTAAGRRACPGAVQRSPAASVNCRSPTHPPDTIAMHPPTHYT
jgi:selenocysteine lyase/cysteine desulfurase